MRWSRPAKDGREDQIKSAKDGRQDESRCLTRARIELAELYARLNDGVYAQLLPKAVSPKWKRIQHTW